MGSNQQACKTIPMVPPCSFWKLIDAASKCTVAITSIFYLDLQILCISSFDDPSTAIFK